MHCAVGVLFVSMQKDWGEIVRIMQTVVEEMWCLKLAEDKLWTM